MAKRGRPRKHPYKIIDAPLSPLPPLAAPADSPPAVESTAEVPPEREPMDVQPKLRNKCPKCKSIRSKLVWTEPGSDGRMEIRRCKSCLTKFKVWDEEWTK